MRCLVTGVAGFIGSHVAERLISDGHTVLGIDAFIASYPRALKEANLRALRRSARFQFIEGDLCALDLAPLLAEQDWVFHQAGQAGVRASWGEQFTSYTSNNVQATQRLLEAARHAPYLKRLIYASSSSIYGNTRDLPLRESTLPQPISPYGVTKLAAEHLCLLYWQSYRVPVVALRYFTVYGPRQRPDMSFHRFGQALLSHGQIRVYGDGEQTRDFTYIADVVEANLLAAERLGIEGLVCNIAGGSCVSLAHAIHLMEELVGRKAEVLHLDTARGDMRDTFADVRLAREALGFTPHVSIRDGLAAELAYLRELHAYRGASE